MTAPAFRERMGMRRPSDNKILDDQLKVSQLFHGVFGTPEGRKVLDYICQNICFLDTALPDNSDPMLLAAQNGRRNVGLQIAGLALLPYDDAKPEVKG